MPERFWWLLIGAIVVVVIVLAAWFFWPRPIRSAGPMPTTPQEKAQRWPEAMKKAMEKVAPGTPIKPGQ